MSVKRRSHIQNTPPHEHLDQKAPTHRHEFHSLLTRFTNKSIINHLGQLTRTITSRLALAADRQSDNHHAHTIGVCT